ncbi:MAG TPA: PAC2 family protein [Candidatus Nanoarchaeia archaeon]|nr:PAC2 family protein [Candidatus Nanoarchaeia archaeon]
MSTWKFEQTGKKPHLRRPILIEGLPGIGNVGKVAVDFLIDELKAKKMMEISSYTFPHSVFVNEDNLVELPTIELFYKKFNGNKSDLLLLAGDVQPIDEVSSYEFCEKMLDLAEGYNCGEIITLGGIGLSEVPKLPRVYCTGNSKEMIKKYKTKSVEDNLYGIVGPIVGVSGLLLGMSAKRRIKAITFLAETYGHPMYLGIKGAREILKVLDQNLSLHLNIKRLESEIKQIETEIMKKTEELSNVTRSTALKKLKRLGKETSYIG